jgi:predicted RecB family nuclease
MENNFSKKHYLLGLRCPKSLFLQVHNQELEEIDSATEIVMKGGKEFELVARELIASGGLDIYSLGKNMDDYVQRTILELEKKNQILYQAAFKNSAGEVALTDVLIKEDKEIHLIEIKGITALTDIEYYDAAFQYYVLTSCGVKIDKVSIAYINRDYIRDYILAPELVAVEDVTKVIKKLQSQIPKKIVSFKKVLALKEVPDKEIGMHCLYPNPCSFKNHCWDGFSTNSIFDMRSMKISKKFGLYYKGITTMEQLAASGRNDLSDGQIMQITCALENKIVVQPVLLRAWLEPLVKAKGVLFMDFESINPGVPMFRGTKSFTQICTQYSIHYHDRIKNKFFHLDYLADPSEGTDIREEFIKNLINDVAQFDKTAPITVFNRAFEETRLRELARLFPEHGDDIKVILSRIVDIMDVFRSKIYYDPRFKGSYSIKAILPVMCPALSYKDLEINNGAQAASEFLKLFTVPRKEAKKIRKALLEYCKLDTYAMLALLEKLEEISSKCIGDHISLNLEVPGEPIKNKRKVLTTK